MAKILSMRCTVRRQETTVDPASPNLRFDAFVGRSFTHRLAHRVTLTQLLRVAQEMHLSIDWDSMHMIGATTAEINLQRGVQ